MVWEAQSIVKIKTSLGNTENWAAEKANGKKNHKISRVAFQGTLKRGTWRVGNGSIKLTKQPDSGAATNLNCFCIGLSQAWSRTGWGHCAPSHLLPQCPGTILHSAMKAGAMHRVQRWRGDPISWNSGGRNSHYLVKAICWTHFQGAFRWVKGINYPFFFVQSANMSRMFSFKRIK